MAIEEKNTGPLGQDLEGAPPGPGDNARDLLAQDEAIAMVGEQEHALDPVVVARAVRKIDWFLIPAMIFGCTSPVHSSLLKSWPR
jgi:hypothetical protein